MRRSLALLIFITVILIGVSGCGDRHGRVIPVADFFSSPEKINFRISPSGQYIAYLGLQDRDRTINIINLDNECQEQRITAVSDVQGYFWADDKELVFTKEKKNDSLQIFALNRETLAIRQIMQPSSVKLRWLAPPKVINNSFLISINERDPAAFDVYRLHVDACKKELVAKNPGNIIRWFADLNGELRLALASDSVRETMLYRGSERDSFKPVMSSGFRNSVMPLGFSSKKRSHVFALSNINRDKLALVEIDMETGEEVNVIFSHEDVDIGHGGYSADRGEMAYATYATWKEQRHFLDQKTQAVYDAIERKLDGYELSILDRDTARNRFIVRTFTDKDPGAIYYFDMAADNLVKLADNNPALSDGSFASMKPITYTARDGRQINGYLTMPIGRERKRVPVIVYPHGGPGARSNWGFHPEVQYFANRGYAVFQVNYRGSTGYGKEFWSAGLKQWGGKIQDDITDGVRWLISEGIADSSRIGIFGAGFGGYSALHAACFNSDLYACAASYSGFTNLFTYIKEIPPHRKLYLQMYYEVIGNPETEPDMIRAMSPVFHSERIEIPVFIAQGGKDSWSAVNETNQFVQKLRKRKIPVTYMLREEEGRFFRNEENQILFYRELGDFFDKYLK